LSGWPDRKNRYPEGGQWQYRCDQRYPSSWGALWISGLRRRFPEGFGCRASVVPDRATDAISRSIHRTTRNHCRRGLRDGPCISRVATIEGRQRCCHLSRSTFWVDAAGGVSWCSDLVHHVQVNALCVGCIDYSRDSVADGHFRPDPPRRSAPGGTVLLLNLPCCPCSFAPSLQSGPPRARYRATFSEAEVKIDKLAILGAG